jgi:hypothetical protein
MIAAPQDIPFWPDYINRELGGSFNWVLAPRLTERLRGLGHEVAIHPKKYAEMQRRHAEEVRAAVRLQMIELIAHALEPDAATPSEIVTDLLALPGLRIETENREWPGTELERHREARDREHAEQTARREARA